jgi:hypothetical protein
MLVIPTIGTDEEKVRFEVSRRENGCVLFVIESASVTIDAILDEDEKKELVKWLS